MRIYSESLVGQYPTLKHGSYTRKTDHKHCLLCLEFWCSGDLLKAASLIFQCGDSHAVGLWVLCCCPLLDQEKAFGFPSPGQKSGDVVGMSTISTSAWELIALS